MLLLLLALFVGRVAEAKSACIPVEKMQKEDIARCEGKEPPLGVKDLLIAYTSPSHNGIAAIAQMIGSKVTPVRDSESAKVKNYYTLDGKAVDASCEFYYERSGEDRCVFYSTLPKKTSKEWRLLSSIPLKPKQLIQDKAAKNAFKAIDPGCRKGIEGNECISSKLIAVTDLNEDGILEVIYTMVMGYDEGIAVTEYNPKLKSKLETFTACGFCSD